MQEPATGKKQAEVNKAAQAQRVWDSQLERFSTDFFLQVHSRLVHNTLCATHCVQQHAAQPAAALGCPFAELSRCRSRRRSR